MRTRSLRVRRYQSLVGVSLLKQSYCDSDNGEPLVYRDRFVASLDQGVIIANICSFEGLI